MCWSAVTSGYQPLRMYFSGLVRRLIQSQSVHSVWCQWFLVCQARWWVQLLDTVLHSSNVIPMAEGASGEMEISLPPEIFDWKLTHALEDVQMMCWSQGKVRHKRLPLIAEMMPSKECQTKCRQPQIETKGDHVNYLAKFCPQLSKDGEVLRELTRKDCEWKWTAQHEKAFLKLKGQLHTHQC